MKPIYYGISEMGDTAEEVQFDAEYLKRLREGDAETESHFSRNFGKILRLKLLNGVRSWQMLQDVMQETLLRVLLAVRSEGITQPASLGAFVCATSNHVLWEYRRMEEKYGGITADEVPEPADERMELERGLITEERKKLVESVLAELSPKERTALRKLFLEEKSKAEVCQEMQVSPEYLRVLVHRAKASFRQKMTLYCERLAKT
ncbi:MAG TPA: sigma-70 family RNA polymerase sigma factor [Bryobacteraceae bacterium]|nr:sigma-70 family RNA polymerase sigma factor [Bryobacteraceae bacterium]HOL70716.1 sigma-70 family RNA polymerase sigma factor [Bryobacteraceae bacterium]HPQ14622.1 sigma-70 family RNA polymerase sigma factor [Bryobacteraceae bacterium]